MPNELWSMWTFFFFYQFTEHRVGPSSKNGLSVSVDLQWDGYLPGWDDDGCPHEDSHDLQWDGYFPGRIKRIISRATIHNQIRDTKSDLNNR